mmetsp:Transcript_66574/g.98694  ORF Transcript_66574/g.98694 Transcript_66574/m.98694 type:complete len:82 (+) Transcript_66574:689-934(+)
MVCRMLYLPPSIFALIGENVVKSCKYQWNCVETALLMNNTQMDRYQMRGHIFWIDLEEVMVECLYIYSSFYEEEMLVSLKY